MATYRVVTNPKRRIPLLLPTALLGETDPAPSHPKASLGSDPSASNESTQDPEVYTLPSPNSEEYAEAMELLRAVQAAANEALHQDDELDEKDPYE